MKSASIQPRTSPSKFGGKFNSLFIRLLEDIAAESGTDAHRAAEREWLDRGRLVARTVFRTLADHADVTEMDKGDGSVDVTVESSDYEAAEV